MAVRLWGVIVAAALVAPLSGTVAEAASADDAATATVTGTVWMDRDGDGVRDAGEPALGDVAVSDGLQVVRTGKDGGYSLALDVDRRLTDIVAVTLPSGYRVPLSAVRTPEFYRDLGELAAGARANADFGLIPDPRTAKGDPNFVTVSDVHVADYGNGIDAERERARAQFEQLNDLADRPDFVLVSGDLTNSAEPSEFENYQAAASSSRYPIWTSAGNHEIDSGPNYAAQIENYRHYQGPEWYSFDYRDLHVVMLENYRGQNEADQLEWLRRDLAEVPAGRRLVAVAHIPFSGGLTEANETPLIDLLRDHRVSLVLSGHVHGNDTDPTTFPGGQQIVTSAAWAPQEGSPEGFRRILGRGKHSLSTPFTAFDREQQLTIVNPAPGTTLHKGGPAVLVNAYDTTNPPTRVEYRVDGGTWRPLQSASRWSWTDKHDLNLAAGPHHIDARAVGRTGQPWTTSGDFTVTDEAAAQPKPDADWPTLQGDNERSGHATGTVSGPLDLAWVYRSGGAILTSSPVVAGGIAYVGIRDEDGIAEHGVAAIDPKTGKELWRRVTDAPVDATPAVADGLVHVSTVRGTVLALDAKTGAVVWQVRTGVGSDAVQRAWSFAGPAVADGVVYQSVGYSLLALDARTGAQRWSFYPATDGYGGTDRPAAPTVAGDLVLFTGDGRYVTAVDRATGKERWRHYPTIPARYRSAPTVADGRVFLQGEGSLEVLDLATGNLLWKDSLGGNEGRGTPAVSGSVVVSPIGGSGIAAYDVASGQRLWSTTGGPVEASPLISGETVYVGSKDGRFSAVDLHTGKVTWSRNIGTWVNSSAAPTGNLVLVGAYDGNVYGFTG